MANTDDAHVLVSLGNIRILSSPHGASRIDWIECLHLAEVYNAETRKTKSKRTYINSSTNRNRPCLYIKLHHKSPINQRTRIYAHIVELKFKHLFECVRDVAIKVQILTIHKSEQKTKIETKKKGEENSENEKSKNENWKMQR